MWKKIRVSLLLLLLVLVALSAFSTRLYSTSWKHPLRVSLIPVTGDDSDRTADYLKIQDGASFRDIGEFMGREASRHGLALKEPVELTLEPGITQLPPTPPASGQWWEIAAWSLKLRYWAWVTPRILGPRPHVKLFVVYHDPDRNDRLPHSLGLEKGQIGVVHAFASRHMAGSNNVIIAHELLHTLGARDKYEPGSNLPRHPDGYADPDARPLHPQEHAEIMGGRIPLSPGEAKVPPSLEWVVVGPATAREINWVP
jgi:hypothetical protein